MTSKRVDKIDESGIRKVFEMATKAGKQLVNLSIGQPHFPAPAKLKKAAKDAVQGNFNGYSSTMGLPDLREKIAKDMDVKVDEIMITSGVSGGLFLAFGSLMDNKEEIIIPEPYFVLYKELLTFLESKPVLWDTYPDFHPNVEKLEKLIKSKTRAILINSPNNPTGAVYSKKELQEIARIARKHDLWIISDEIYDKFDYDGKFIPMRKIYKKTITLNGFSKSHAVAGWRVGYVHAPKEIINQMNKLQQYSFVCAPAFAQAALAQCFKLPELKKQYAAYKNKRDIIWEGLKDHYEFNKPEGAFYAFIKMPKNRPNFIDELIDKKVLVVPGNVFSHRNDYFRISFAAKDESLKRGVKILRELVS